MPSPREELRTLFNDLILADNEIYLITTFDAGGEELVSNTECDPSGTRPDAELKNKARDIAVSLTKLKDVQKVLADFGKESNRGKLEYAVFQLEKGILLAYFLENCTVAVVSSTKEGLGLMRRGIEKRIDRIKELM